jgi:hypothetical protein
MNTNRGFASLIVILLVVVLGLGGYYAVTQTKSDQAITEEKSTEESSQTTPVPSTVGEKTAAVSPSCSGRDAMVPFITAIVPASGPAGAKVEIRGCNLSGYEGDLEATFERSDGAHFSLYGGTWYRKVIDAAEPTSMTVTVDSYCPHGSITGRYSGLDQKCETVAATPGTYKVRVVTPSGTSNTVIYTITSGTSTQ